MRRFFVRTTEQGQVLLMIILVMVVSLTVGLSVVTRSITNVRVSTEEENSQRAFYAAEAGVEQALKTRNPIAIPNPQALPDGFSRIESVTISATSGQQVLLDKLALKDEVAPLWLVDYENPPASGWDGTLTIYWGRESDPGTTCTSDEASNSASAVEIIIIVGRSNPIATHYAYDPCTERRGRNNFSEPNIGTYSGVIPEMTFRYRAILPVIDNGMIVNVVPLYTNTPIAVSASGDTLPAQGKRIESIGSSGGTQHKIVVLQGNPKFPTEFFPYLILSPL